MIPISGDDTDTCDPETDYRGSSAAQWPPIAAFICYEADLSGRVAARGPWSAATYEFLRFGVKQGWACLFGAILLFAVIATRFGYPAHAPLARYDFLFLFAVGVQVFMLIAKLETADEAIVIFAFHIVGTLMEVHKTAIGSWTYPETSFFHIGHVPLFTGFMYASVGSYLARVWRLFDFRFARHPGLPALTALAIAIYANFLTDHLGFDMRWGLIAITSILFARTVIYFKVWRVHRSMPLLIGFVLVALFIWFAENIGTFTGTWLYPRQLAHWTFVPISKLASWFMLMIVSYTMVAWANGITARATNNAPVAPTSSVTDPPLP